MYGEAKERGSARLPFSAPKFLYFQELQNVFASAAADAGASFTLTGMGEPVQLFGGKVTANYFELLGIRPMRGRNFLPEEEMRADVALVTESFWRRYFNADSRVLGRTITLDNVPTTIVGVLPNLPAVWFGPYAEVYTVKPFELRGTPPERIARGMSFLRCIGRLKPASRSGRRRRLLRRSIAVIMSSILITAIGGRHSSWPPPRRQQPICVRHSWCSPRR
jgi:hypothetical protein